MKRLLAAGIISLVPLACSKEVKDYRLEGPGVIYEDDETRVVVKRSMPPAPPPPPKIEEKRPGPKLEPEPEPIPIIEVKVPAPKPPPVYVPDSVVNGSSTPASKAGRR